MADINIHAVVRKLIGPIDPVGDSVIDERRFENLKVQADLMRALMDEILDIEQANQDRAEYSMKRAGEYCESLLDKLQNQTPE